ncbi:hypothetical protein ACJMK2_041619 [Sinanodonta woodiana]|uniref:G-protein coupled receptors family 1 profile domain-containing protein n=1 Tax=Sinanodonta woodiana TaxID=1069815 RepID=A0ABD3W4Q2_SINWO
MAGFQQSSTPVSEIKISSSNITNLNNTEFLLLTFSDKVTDGIIFVTECFLNPIISVFGLTGSVLSIASILLQLKMRISTAICMVALAMSNSLFLITNALWKSTCIIKSSDMVLNYKYNANIVSVLFYLKISFCRISSWLMVVIASEKMVAVTLPLKVKIYCTKRNISVLIILISTATLLFMSPFCLIWKVDYIYDRNLQAIRVYMKETENYRDNTDPTDNYINYFLVIAFRYLPLASVVVVNTKIGIVLWKNKRFRQMTFPNSRNASMSKEERRITFLLVTVVTVFIICLLPVNVHVAVTIVVEEYNLFRKYHNLYITMDNVSLLLELLNPSVILFMYMATNKQFMKMLKGIFCKCTYKHWTRASQDNSHVVNLMETQPKAERMSTFELPHTTRIESPGTTKTVMALEVRSTNHLDQSRKNESTML